MNWEEIIKDLIARNILLPDEYQHILDTIYGR